MSTNQPTFLPRNPGSPAGLLSVSSVKEGRSRVMFGPGQGPETIFGDYSPPTEWPSAGSLLRPIQVAWITAEFLDAKLDDKKPKYKLNRSLHTVDAWKVFLQSYFGYNKEHIPGYPVSDPVTGNPIYETTFRMDYIDGTIDNTGYGRIKYYVAEDRTWARVNPAFFLSGQWTADIDNIDLEPNHTVGTELTDEEKADWYKGTLDNPHQELMDKFHDEIIPAVIARVRAKRKNRTWARECKWTGGDATTQPMWSIQAAPDPASYPKGFYGVDFLHIHIGVPRPSGPGGDVTDYDAMDDDHKAVADDVNDKYDESEAAFEAKRIERAADMQPTPYDWLDANADPDTISGGDAWTAGKARVKAALNSMAGFAVKVYGATLDYGEPTEWRSWPTDPPETPGDTPIRYTDKPVGEVPDIFTTSPDPWDQLITDPWTTFWNSENIGAPESDSLAALEAKNVEMRARVAQWTTRKQARDAAMNSALQSLVSGMGKGYTYMGEVSDSTTADDLYDVIAAHFKFDA